MSDRGELTPPRKRHKVYEKPKQTYRAEYHTTWSIITAGCDKFHAFCNECQENVPIHHQGAKGKSIVSHQL